jgi:hypothetical protein
MKDVRYHLMGYPGSITGGSNLQAAIFDVPERRGDRWHHSRCGRNPRVTQVYFKKAHPAAGEVTVVGINIPVKIGEAVVLPETSS